MKKIWLYALLLLGVLAGCRKDAARNIIPNTYYGVTSIDQNGDVLTTLFPNATDLVYAWFDKNKTGYLGVPAEYYMDCGSTTLTALSYYDLGMTNDGVHVVGFPFSWSYIGRDQMQIMFTVPTDGGTTSTILQGFNADLYSVDRNSGMRISPNEAVLIKNSTTFIQLAKRE